MFRQPAVRGTDRSTRVLDSCARLVCCKARNRPSTCVCPRLGAGPTIVHGMTWGGALSRGSRCSGLLAFHQGLAPWEGLEGPEEARRGAASGARASKSRDRHDTTLRLPPLPDSIDPRPINPCFSCRLVARAPAAYCPPPSQPLPPPPVRCLLCLLASSVLVLGLGLGRTWPLPDLPRPLRRSSDDLVLASVEHPHAHGDSLCLF